MECLSCTGPLEYVQDVKFARCTHCLALFNVNDNGPRRWLTPLEVRTSNGQIDPAFTAAYAEKLGFEPRKQSHKVFGVGPVGVKVNTGRMERDIKNQISSWIWGIIIGAFILILLAGVFGWIIWTASKAKNETAHGADPRNAKAAKWDGAQPFTCGGADNVKIEKVTAEFTAGAAVKAAGNCQLVLVNVNLSAPIAIEAGGNATVTVQGGSVKGGKHAAVATANAKINFEGTTVQGPTKTLGNGKILGAK